MYSLSLNVIYSVMFLFCMNLNTFKDKNVNSAFVSWNRFTLTALTAKIKSSSTNAEKKTYRNRLKAFKSFVEIEQVSSVNEKSIRHQFLKKIDLVNRNNFFVIEANKNGETITLMNYVIYLQNKTVTAVDIYCFNEGKWNKKVSVRKIGNILIDNLQDLSKRSNSGFNNSDIIISQFINASCIGSEYCLYGTLSENGPLAEILSLK